MSKTQDDRPDGVTQNPRRCERDDEVKASGRDVLYADDVAKFLGVGRNTVYDAAGRGEIPHRRLGKRLLFSRTALLEWLDSRPEKSTTRR